MRQDTTSAGVASVTIIIPVLNRLNDTLECLRSLFDTHYRNLRVIVVDNGSVEDYAGALDRHFPSVLLIRSETNLGFVGGVNLGLQHALRLESDYIWLLNNDTLVDRSAIDQLVAAAQTSSQYQIFSPLITFADQPDRIWFSGGRWNRHKWTVEHENYRQPTSILPADIYPTSWANGCALFCSRHVFEAVGSLDTAFFALWEEIDWCYRAARMGFRCAIQPGARIHHKVSASFGSHLSPRYVYLNTRNRLLFIRKSAGLARALHSTIGQLIVAGRHILRAVSAHDGMQFRVGLAMTQANIDAVCCRVGMPQLWLGDQRSSETREQR